MKITNWLMMAMLGLFIASCSDSKEELFRLVDPVPVSGELKTFSSFTATFDDLADTRAHIVDGAERGNKHIAWDDLLPIAVFSDLQNKLIPYELTDNVDGIGTFTGESVNGNVFYSLYPFLDEEECYLDEDHPNILHTLLLPDALTNTFEDFLFLGPMVAKNNENVFNFKQTTGMIHVSISDVYKIVYVVFKGNNQEKLSGYGQIDLSGDNPVFVVTDDNEDYVYESVAWINKKTDGNAIDIYFVIPPTTFRDGFTLSINAEDEEGNDFLFNKVFSNEISVDRATVKHFSLINVNEEIVEKEAKIRAALKAFYEALDGDHWIHNDNWNDDNVPLTEWYGIYQNYDGSYNLELYDNNLSGDVPKEIADFSYLKVLNLNNNTIKSIPEEISQLNHLQALLLSYNQLSSLPTSLFKLEDLDQIEISNNQFSEIPAVVGQLKNLRWLWANYNMISELPSWLSKLTNLERLDLSNNNLSGSLPEFWIDMHNLKELSLFDNQFTGTIPESIGNLKNLAELSLGRNKLSGIIPRTITNLTKLIRLDMSNNKLSGTIPENISSLTRLDYLNLSSNQLSGVIPESIGNLANVTSLYLYGNQLSGNIPGSIGNMKSLKHLMVSGNELSGNIPESIGNLGFLETLFLDFNRFSGNIPESIWNLTNLTNFELVGNQLTGSISNKIGNLTSLERIDFGFNKLSGEIPKEIGNLINLEYLWLNDNELTGSIPESFENLINIKMFYVTGNHLSGIIPKAVHQSNWWKKAEENNQLGVFEQNDGYVLVLGDE